MIKSPFVRFAFATPLVIACIVGAVFFPLYREAEGDIRDAVHAAIEQEILALEDDVHDQGLEALVAELDRRIASPIDPDAVYLLTAADGRVMAGNLPAWPAALPARDEVWFRIRDDGGHNVEGKVFILFGGERLLVGRRSPLAPFRESMAARMRWSAALVIVATSLMVAMFMRRLHRRLARLAEEVAAIRRGHLSLRLSESGRGDELDILARRFNEGFDEIERLVEAARHVSTALAHDMRRPLIALRNALEEAMRGGAGASTLGPTLEPLLEQTSALLQTCAALLRLARIEAGTLDAGGEVCRVDEIARDAIELYAAVAEAEGRHVEAMLEAVTVYGDRNLLFQLVENLLDNALTYGGGDICVEVRGEPGGDAVLVVRDHGGGVPQEALPRLFERFYRVDASRSDDRNFGIGLALVKAIAEAHRGSAKAENADPGLRVEVRLAASAPPST